VIRRIKSSCMHRFTPASAGADHTSAKEDRSLSVGGKRKRVGAAWLDGSKIDFLWSLFGCSEEVS
jgi:hypothetical protein